MNETLTGTHVDTASHMEAICRERLNALVRGEASEEEFISEFATLPQDGPDPPWNLADWISAQHNRGQVPDELFHSLESKLAEFEMNTADYGETAELHPVARRRRRPPPAFVEGPTAARRVVGTGTVLRDRYVIEERLGTGGMGTVFKALDQFRGDLAETNRHVALKVLNDEICHRPEVFAKLRREFYCAQSLSHRNIVRVFELDRDGDIAFFTMEFLEGELLSRIIERFRPGTVSRSYAWRVIREIGAALTHAHARDVVHADLKPQNIIIMHSGDVRLLDFGTSSVRVRTNPPQDSASGAAKGGPTALTPAYASCELLEGQRADPRDDLFAFACLAYELLTGQHPFGQRRSTEARALGLEVARPPGLGEGQWKTLLLGLAWSRAERSMAVRDWVAALNRKDEPAKAAVTEPLQAPMPAVAPPASPPVPPMPDLPSLPAAPAPKARQASVPSSVRWLLLLAALLAGFTLWVTHRRPPVATRIETPRSPSMPAAAPPPVAAAPTASVAPVAVKPPPRTATALPVVAKPPPAAARPTARAARAATKSDAIPTISIASRSYRVRANGHFAEVHVRRSAGTSGRASFVWWTEPGSARADEDYFSQARTTQTFSAGLKSASLFVRLVPSASRESARIFYVVIGDPSAGNALGRVTRVPVLLPPRSATHSR